MNKPVEARLQWLSPDDGGRQSPPSGPRYTTVARFESEKESWLNEAWSLVVEFVDPPDTALSHRVRVNFLSERGPESLLKRGSSFELMEGVRPVARGTVIE